MRIRAALLLSMVFVWLAACGSSPVANDISQREAHEIIAALRGRGIEATSSKGQGGRAQYSVLVASKDFGRAVSILHSLGLPGEHRASFSELVSPSGLIPSSKRIEELRIDRARAAEIEDLLRGHPAVAKVSAVVRSPSAEGMSPSISVVVQKRRDGLFSVPEVSQLLTRAVPGVKPEDVVFSVAEEGQTSSSDQPSESSTEATLVPFLIYWRVAAGDYNGLAMITIGLLVAVSVMAGLAGYIFGQYNVTRNVEPRYLEPLEAPHRMEQLSAPKESDVEGAGDE